MLPLQSLTWKAMLLNSTRHCYAHSVSERKPRHIFEEEEKEKEKEKYRSRNNLRVLL